MLLRLDRGFLVQVGLERVANLLARSSQLAKRLSDGPPHLRETPGPHDQKRHQEDDDEFHRADVEHGSSPGSAGPRPVILPSGQRLRTTALYGGGTWGPAPRPAPRAAGGGARP